MGREQEPQRIAPEFNLTLSMQVAEKTHPEPKRCWANALSALRTVKALHGAYYVEGWALLDVAVPIEHGWLELPHSIVDPTYALLLKNGSAQSLHPVYFAGVRYTREAMKGIAVTKLPHVYSFGGFGGFTHEPYKRAFDQAVQKARDYHV